MRRATLALALAALVACGNPSPQARDGWIRAPAPGATAMAGYVTLVNPTTTALTCTGVHGPDFGAAELHRTIIEDGVSRMRREASLSVPARGEVALAPGGLHIMLFRPQRELKPGDRAKLRFDCGGQALSAELELRAGP